MENLHITLKFLGEIEGRVVEKVKILLKKIRAKRFIATIDQIGLFENRQQGILWLHVAGIEKLQKEIDHALAELFQPEKRFMSHLTIARIKSVENIKKFKEALRKIKISKFEFSVSNFRLKKSVLTPSGPVYSTLEEYVLS